MLGANSAGPGAGLVVGTYVPVIASEASATVAALLFEIQFHGASI